MKQRTFLFILLLLSTLTASAYYAQINNIYYDLPGSVAVVTGISQDMDNNTTAYSGDVIIPSTVTYNGKIYKVTAIGCKAFYQCRDMTSVSIPNSVTSIGESAFEGCSGLSSVEIPNGVTSIGAYAFRYCSRMKNVTIPNSVVKIGISVFRGCSQLTTVKIPNSLTEIGKDMFYGCSKLSSVYIPNSVTIIDSQAFLECYSLTDIEIPNSVTTIGSYAFYGCSGLTFISIPNSVKDISYNVFEGCNKLTSVSIGNGINSISTDAFKCNNLVSVSIEATKPPTISSSTFSSMGKITLYVPTGCKSAYQNANWNGFKSIMEVDMYIEQCATPTITFDDGELHFSCITEDVKFIYNIVPISDISGEGIDVSIPTNTTYRVTVYAKKDGYENSDVATKEIEIGSGSVAKKGDVNEDGTVNGTDIQEVINIIVNGSDEDEQAYSSCPDDNHPHMIDLGLPSGTKWACCNVGASKPEEYGNYYAWGETSTKSTYNTDTYLFYDSSTSTYFDLGRDIAGTKYDAATANWGASWCMPNWKQCYELEKETTSKLTLVNGVNGRIFTGKNGKSIFLPAAGIRWNSSLDDVGVYGGYRSSEADNCIDNGCASVMTFDINCEKCLNIDPFAREEGWSVRSVRK